MKKNFIFTRFLAVVLALICMLSMTLAVVSCSNDDSNIEGEGTPITITLEVIGPDGSSKEHTVSTDSSKNLRQALEGAGLIAGDEGAYGLYVRWSMGSPQTMTLTAAGGHSPRMVFSARVLTPPRSQTATTSSLLTASK